MSGRQATSKRASFFFEARCPNDDSSGILGQSTQVAGRCRLPPETNPRAALWGTIRRSESLAALSLSLNG